MCNFTEPHLSVLGIHLHTDIDKLLNETQVPVLCSNVECDIPIL